MAEYTNNSARVDLTGNEILADQVNVKTASGFFINSAAVTTTAAEVNVLAGVVAGTTSASKVLVVDANKRLDTLDVVTFKNKTFTLAAGIWVDIAAPATALNSAGTVSVIVGNTGDQFKIRNIVLVGGGTNFAGGGDRNLSLTDGTTTWTTIAAADLQAAPSASLMWGNAKVPFLTGTSNTASVAGGTISFKYSGGTLDYNTAGTITFSVHLQKVA